MGSHFHDLIDYNWVAFSIVTRMRSGFGGKKILVSKGLKMGRILDSR